MQINKWKIFGYTAITWFGFSVLARIISEMASQSGGHISIVSCQGAVWGWMSLFMGIYLATRFKKWIELVWGAVLFFICTLPVIGMFIGIGYFARAYVKLEKARWGEGVADAQSTLEEFTADAAHSKEEEQKAREVKEKAAQEEAHAAWILAMVIVLGGLLAVLNAGDAPQWFIWVAVVLVLGGLLAGYWAFAPGSTDAQSTLEKFTADAAHSKEEEQKAREVKEKAAWYPLQK